MEQHTVSYAQQVVVSTSDSSRSVTKNWTHYDTTNLILESVALQFTAGSSGYYVIVTENVGNNWYYRLQKQQATTIGNTVSLTLNAEAWEGKTSGTLKVIFYKYQSGVNCIYNNVQMVFTYRNKATASTITVIRTMALILTTYLLSILFGFLILYLKYKNNATRLKNAK